MVRSSVKKKITVKRERDKVSPRSPFCSLSSHWTSDSQATFLLLFSLSLVLTVIILFVIPHHRRGIFGGSWSPWLRKNEGLIQHTLAELCYYMTQGGCRLSGNRTSSSRQVFFLLPPYRLSSPLSSLRKNNFLQSFTLVLSPPHLLSDLFILVSYLSIHFVLLSTHWQLVHSSLSRLLPLPSIARVVLSRFSSHQHFFFFFLFLLFYTVFPHLSLHASSAFSSPPSPVVILISLIYL